MSFCPHGGSRPVSLMSSVSRAYSLLCHYLLEEVPARVETEDDDVRAAGRTYRTPRRLLVPSATLVKGRALCRHQAAQGGLTTLLVPGACVSTSTHPDTAAMVSVLGKWRLQSGCALLPSGPLPPPRAMEAPEVLWHWRGATDGGFIVASPGHLVSLHSQCRRGPTEWRRWCPSPQRAISTVVVTSSAGGPVDGATGARPLCVPRHRSSHLPNGWRRWRMSPSCHLTSVSAGLT